MDKNTPIYQIDWRAASLRPPPPMALENIESARVCEACPERITKVYIRLSYVGLLGVGMLKHGSARPNVRNVMSAVDDKRPAIIAVPPRPLIGPSRNANMKRCASSLITASSACLLIFSLSPLILVTRCYDEFD
jgi:hypothetical protein